MSTKLEALKKKSDNVTVVSKAVSLPRMYAHINAHPLQVEFISLTIPHITPPPPTAIFKHLKEIKFAPLIDQKKSSNTIVRETTLFFFGIYCIFHRTLVIEDVILASLIGLLST